MVSMRRILSPFVAAVACGCAVLLYQAQADAQTRELATKGELLDRVAAVVNDGVVLASELDDQITIVSERLRQQKLELPPQNVLRQQVLERLVLQEIETQRANKAGLKQINLGVRPESFHAEGKASPDGETYDATGLKIEVKLVEELGADAYVYGELPGDSADSKPFVVRFDGRIPPRIGEVLTIDVRTGEEHAFHPETGERLG